MAILDHARLVVERVSSLRVCVRGRGEGQHARPQTDCACYQQNLTKSTRDGFIYSQLIDNSLPVGRASLPRIPDRLTD